MMKKNYRGRFQGKPIPMKAERRKEKTMTGFSRYNKFWVALAGVALTIVTSFTGIDTVALGITPEAVVSTITAVLVYAIPNKR